MTQPGIEPRSPRPLANTLTAKPNVLVYSNYHPRFRCYRENISTIVPFNLLQVPVIFDKLQGTSNQIINLLRGDFLFCCLNCVKTVALDYMYDGVQNFLWFIILATQTADN